MIPLRRFALACAGSMLLAPLAAAAQSDNQAQSPAPAPSPQPEGEAAKEPAAAEASKRVCRSVRADPSSRRKTRVCRTMEEWRGLNVPL